MTRIQVGSEVRFFRWDGVGETFEVFRALVRDWTGPPTGHPSVDLSYFDGSPTNVPNVKNEEFWANHAALQGEDHWRHVMRLRPPGDSEPHTSLSPDIGDAVWYFRYNATHSEHVDHPAIVRTKGPEQRPQIGLFWIKPDQTRQNESNIEAYSEITFPTTDDYWAKRKLFPA